MLSQLPLLKKHRNQKKTQLLKCKKKAVVEKEKTAVKPAVKESKSNAANKNNKQTKPAAQKQEKTMQDKRTPLQNTVVTTSDAVQKTCRKNCGYTYFPSEYGPLQRG